MKEKKIIQKIIKYIDSILKYTSRVTYDEFKDNSMMMEACVFNLSQIGELANKLENDYVKEHSDIPWYKIKGLRNRIVHDYEGINLKLIWEIIKTDLEKLREQLLELND